MLFSQYFLFEVSHSTNYIYNGAQHVKLKNLILQMRSNTLLNMCHPFQTMHTTHIRAFQVTLVKIVLIAVNLTVSHILLQAHPAVLQRVLKTQSCQQIWMKDGYSQSSYASPILSLSRSVSGVDLIEDNQLQSEF